MQATNPEAKPPRPLVRVIINLQYLLTSVAPLPCYEPRTGGFASPPHSGFALVVSNNMHNAGFYYKVPILNGDPSHLGWGKSTTCVTFSMATKQLGNLLNPSNDGDLADLVRRAREMGELTDVLARALPAEHAQGIVAANVREDGELVVIAATSAWASRLRYEADTLLKAAQSVGIKTHICRIRVSQS